MTTMDLYYPFDAGAGAAATEDQWRQMARNWFPSAVVQGEGSELAVFGDSSGMQVKIPTGDVWVNGHLGRITAQKTLAILSADPTNPRIDRIVARLSPVTNLMSLEVLTGTPAGSPTAPALTRSSSQWELSLAQVAVAAAVSTIAVGNVTDERPIGTPSGMLRFASTTARDLHLTSPAAGLMASVAGLAYVYDGSAWKAQAGAVLDTFTGSGTWTKRTGALRVEVFECAGGGGGGSGRKGAAGTLRLGGGGGGGGALAEAVLSADALTSTVTVTVGAGGTGGATQTTNSTDGIAGVDGGASTFGAYLSAAGGAGGAGGNSTSVTPAAGGKGYPSGFSTTVGLANDGGNGAGGSSNNGATGSGSARAGAGGGQGKGRSAANALGTGGAGGSVSGTLLSVGGYAGTIAGGGDFQNGTAGVVGLVGGGGGGATIAPPTGAGGLGGGGGGGGQCGVDSSADSIGGCAGGAGWVVVVTYF